jgi:hypothetical protein
MYAGHVVLTGYCDKRDHNGLEEGIGVSMQYFGWKVCWKIFTCKTEKKMDG